MLCCWSVFKLRIYPQVPRLVRIDDLTCTFSNTPSWRRQFVFTYMFLPMSHTKLQRLAKPASPAYRPTLGRDIALAFVVLAFAGRLRYELPGSQ
jgi:hypothetical protein